MANIKLYTTHYERIITGEDPIYRFSKDIRENIQYSFKNNNINIEGSTMKSLGCSFKSFKKHIESQFEDWMNWNNYCSDCSTTMINSSWCIHYKEIFKIETKEDLYKQNHYSNIIIKCFSEINMYN
tara:strand:+ start:40 stop:417 length:378 start_codon:yes stop_codon:yes gene_type:complete